MSLGTYRRLLDAISFGMMPLVRSAVRVFLSSDASMSSLDDLVTLLYQIVTDARAQARKVAVDFLTEQYGGTGEPFIPQEREYKREYTRKAVVRVIDRNRYGDPDLAVAKSMQAHVEDAARKTVSDAAECEADGEQPMGWARVLTGTDNCAFCVTMASRGPVYKTKGDAGGEEEREFHPNCDCLVVPVFDPDDWPGREVAEKLDDLYVRAKEKYGIETEDQSATHPINAVRRLLTAEPDVLSEIVSDVRSE